MQPSTSVAPNDRVTTIQKATVALIDERSLLRDCIASLLQRHASDFSVSSVSRIQDLDINALSLAVIWIEHGGPKGVRATVEKAENIRQRFAFAPIMAFIECDDPGLVRCAINLGLNLVRLQTTTKDIAVASIRLALAGGIFASSDLLLPQLYEGEGRADCAETETPKPSPESGQPCRQSVCPNYTPRFDGHLSTPMISSGFTPREIEVLERLKRGLQNKTIAYELCISNCTVKVHIRNIMKKLHATNRTQVAFLVRQLSSEPFLLASENRGSLERFERTLDS